MSIEIASLVRGLFEFDGETTDIEHEANALVSGDTDQLAQSETAAWPCMFYYVTGPTAGLHNETKAALDEIAEEAVTDDMSVGKLVQQREQFA